MIVVYRSITRMIIDHSACVSALTASVQEVKSSEAFAAREVGQMASCDFIDARNALVMVLGWTTNVMRLSNARQTGVRAASIGLGENKTNARDIGSNARGVFGIFGHPHCLECWVLVTLTFPVVNLLVIEVPISVGKVSRITQDVQKPLAQCCTCPWSLKTLWDALGWLRARLLFPFMDWHTLLLLYCY